MSTFITPSPVVITNNEPPAIIITQVPGVGPPGSTGGVGGSFTYTHIQGSPANVWTIVHNLGGFPSVTCTQLSGVDDWEVIEGDVLYLDANVIQVTFSAAITGRAYLS